MTIIKFDADSTATHMTTELDSIADDANAISGEIDNTSALRLFEDLEFLLKDNGSYSPSSGGVIEVYLLASIDGTNYPDGSTSIDPASTCFVGHFLPRPVSVDQRMMLRDITIPALKYKYLLINKTGMDFVTGNTLKGVSYSYGTGAAIEEVAAAQDITGTMAVDSPPFGANTITTYQNYDVTVVFSEAVTGLTAGDIALSGTGGGFGSAVGTPAGSGTTYTFSVYSEGDQGSTMLVTIAADAVTATANTDTNVEITYSISVNDGA